jgi:sulfur relay (sulfurtransferase) complex TusBCD TusD component (DsrE family)
MSKYLLIESRDPFDSTDVERYYELARNLAGDGHQVTLFLVQNGVLPARRSSKSELLTRTAKAGVEILVDDFSLRERGIGVDRLAEGVNPAPLDVIVDQLADGRKALWH